MNLFFLSTFYLLLFDIFLRPQFFLLLPLGYKNLFFYYLPSLLLSGTFLSGILSLLPPSRWGRRVYLLLSATIVFLFLLSQKTHYRIYGTLWDEYPLRLFFAEPNYIKENFFLVSRSDFLFALIGGVTFLILPFFPKRENYPRKKGVVAGGIALSLLFLTTQIQFPSHHHNWLSLSLTSFFRWALHKPVVKEWKFPRSPDPVTCPDPPPSSLPNILWIIGESMNLKRLSLYGYERKTTPFLDSIREDLAIGEKAFSIGTWTRVVIPYMLVGHETYDPEHHLLNLPTIFQYGKCRNYTTILLSSQTLIFNNIAHLVVDSFVDIFIDGRTLYPDANIDMGADDGRALQYLKRILLHRKEPFLLLWILNGSHHPYEDHTPPSFRPFKPTSRTPDDLFGFLNGYDNTIAYTDEVIRELFQFLKDHSFQERTVIVFLPDHGERLGPDLFFHGSYEPEELKIPLFFYLPPSYRDASYYTLKKNFKEEYIYADEILPTLLYLLKIPPHPYVTGRNLFLPLQKRRVTITHATLNGPPNATPTVAIYEEGTLYLWNPIEKTGRMRTLTPGAPLLPIPPEKIPFPGK